MFSRLFLILSSSSLLLLGSNANQLRGGGKERRLNQECADLGMEILCQGDCNFTAREGTCESKLFQYHGGPCRGTPQANNDTAADCQDVQPSPSKPGTQVYVVIADASDPSKNSSMWTQVGGYFWTKYEDYPIGLGLSDQQNITFYSSNEAVYDNMLQTMLFYAPCQGTPLEQLAADQSVQLVGTAVDPKIRAYFHLNIERPQPSWNLKSVSVTSSVEPHYQDLLVGDLVVASRSTAAMSDAATNSSSLTVPLVLELDRNDTLTVLGTATLVTASGLECSVSAFYMSRNSTDVGP